MTTGVCAQDGNMSASRVEEFSREDLFTRVGEDVQALSSDLKEAQVLALFCPRAQRAASRSWKRSCFVWSSHVVSVCLYLSLCVPAGVACHLTLVATTVQRAHTRESLAGDDGRWRMCWPGYAGRLADVSPPTSW